MPNDTNEDGAEDTLGEQQRTCYMTQQRTWQDIYRYWLLLLEDNGLKCLPWQSDRGNDGEENYRLLYIWLLPVFKLFCTSYSSFFFTCQHSYTLIWWCEMSETDILMLNVKYRQTDKQTDSQSANVPRDNNGMLHLSFLLFVMLPLARISRTHLLHRRVSALSHHCTDLAVSGHTATLLLFNLHTIVYLFLSPYLS